MTTASSRFLNRNWIERERSRIPLRKGECMEQRSDRFTAIEDQYAGFTVYDQVGEKIGKVDDLFVDESDQPEYIGVKMGFLGTRSTLIPWETVSSTDDGGRAITVDADKATAKNGPAFDDDRRARRLRGLPGRRPEHHRRGRAEGAEDRGRARRGDPRARGRSAQGP